MVVVPTIPAAPYADRKRNGSRTFVHELAFLLSVVPVAS